MEFLGGGWSEFVSYIIISFVDNKTIMREFNRTNFDIMDFFV